LLQINIRVVESKKYPKYDLESKHGLFFNIGLVVALAAVVGMMEWKTFETDGELALGAVTSDFDEVLDIPVTEQPPPPPPSATKNINIIEVPDVEEIEEDIDISLDIDMTDQTVSEEFEIVMDEGPVEEESEEVFTIVEDQPTPKGGYESFYTYVSQNLNYPQGAIRLGIEGKVFVQFVVGTKGAISEVKVVKGISAECDQEAIRVIKKAPNWNPGKQRGRPVKVRMIIPITFMLERS
jgi:protein TonB